MGKRSLIAGHVARLEDRIRVSPQLGLLAASTVSAGCVGLLLAFTDLKTEGTALYRDPGWDRHIYRLMAEEGLFEVRLAPYCWRVLMPALAGWSPFPLQWSFFGLTVAAIWGTGPVVYATLQARKHAPIHSLAIVLLFYALGWGPKFILADFWIPDGVAMLLVALLLWAAVRKELAWFGVFLAIGAVTKESVLLAAPTYLCLNTQRPLEAQQIVRQAAALVPAVLLLIAVRAGVPHHNGDIAYLATLPDDIGRFPELYAHYDYRRLFQEIAVDQRWHDRSFEALLNYTQRPFGLPLLALAGLGARRSGRLALALLPFVALTYAQLLFATDTQRLIVLAAPALALLAAHGLAEAGQRGVPSPVSLAGALAIFLLTLAGPQTYNPPLVAQTAVLASSAAAALIVVVARGRHRRHAPRGPA